MAKKREAIIGTDAPKIAAFYENVELRPGLRADISVPEKRGPHPVLLYIHGGGWVAGSPKSHGRLGKKVRGSWIPDHQPRLSARPEHPFPAGYDDCMFAAQWARGNGEPWMAIAPAWQSVGIPQEATLPPR